MRRREIRGPRLVRAIASINGASGYASSRDRLFPCDSLGDGPFGSTTADRAHGRDEGSTDFRPPSSSIATDERTHRRVNWDIGFAIKLPSLAVAPKGPASSYYSKSCSGFLWGVSTPDSPKTTCIRTPQGNVVIRGAANFCQFSLAQEAMDHLMPNTASQPSFTTSNNEFSCFPECNETLLRSLGEHVIPGRC